MSILDALLSMVPGLAGCLAVVAIGAWRIRRRNRRIEREAEVER